MSAAAAGERPRWTRALAARLRSAAAVAWRAEPSVHAPLMPAADIADLAAQAALLKPWPAREVHDHPAGDWASRWLGRGLDFEESRLYSPGDDTRDMDWRTTARTGRPHLKIYREERQPALHLVVDRSATMRFGTRRRLKAAQAARVASLLAFAAAAQQGVVGATLWDGRDETFAAGHGRLAALDLVGRLNAPCPPLDDPAPADGVRMHDRLVRLEAGLPRGARVVLISDFVWLAAAHAPLLARLAARFDVRALRIVDAVEQALPDAGLVRIHDMARRRDVWLDTGRASVRAACAAAFARRIDAQGGIIARAGIAHRIVDSAADDLVALLGHG